MAMLAGQMLMQPEVRKGMSKVAKYLLLFGGLGVAVIAFIVLAKKFDPFKAVGSFFGNAFKGVSDFFKNILGGVGAVTGGLLGKEVPKELVYKEKVKKWYGTGEEDENVRREFRRYSKLVIRALEVLKTAEGVPKDVSARISLVQSAFRKVDKTFVRDIAKQFEVVWDRKREFLKGNLEGSFKKEEMVAIAKELAREGAGYGAKLTYMEHLGEFR